MKILKTASYKKAQAEGRTVDLYARYTGDGYLAHAEYTSDPNVRGQGDKFWPDYYSDTASSEPKTVLLKGVPIDLAKKLVEQGGSQQWFDDGYEAANAAAPYIQEDREQKYKRQEEVTDDRIMDTPMGFEDDNLSDLDF